MVDSEKTLRSVKQSRRRLKIIALGAAAVLLSRYALPASFELQSAGKHPTATMRAVRYREHGGPSVLELESSVPRPVPRKGQILVAVEYSSINPCDFKFRRNYAPSFIVPKPKIPGADIAGVVVECEPTSKFKVRSARNDHVLVRTPTSPACALLWWQ